MRPRHLLVAVAVVIAGLAAWLFVASRAEPARPTSGERIIAFGGCSELDQGYCVAESGSVPVSGIAPAILLSEIEMQQSSTTGFHEPLLPPPFADDGSSGRTADLRRRGRRRRRK